jgi:TolA-binding protein
MIRTFLGSALALTLLVNAAAGQAPDKASGDFLKRVDAADLQAQRDRLQQQLAELETRISALELQRAELLRQLKTAQGRLAEVRGAKAGAESPLLFPPSIERAMLQDAQPGMSRPLKVNPFDLPERFELRDRLPPARR